jgi:ketosteroid isomerase-like protein
VHHPRASTLLAMLLAIALCGACTHRSGGHRGHHACRSQQLQAEETRRLALDLFEALNAADVDRLNELYADDFEIWTAGSMPISGTRNKQQALAGMKMIDTAFPDGIVFGITAMTVEGERAAIEAVSNGVHASGLAYHNQYHFLMVAREGRIVSFREYMDTQHANEVLIESAAP